MIPIMLVFLFCIASVFAQPQAVADGVLFTYENDSATRVGIGADWNGWQPENSPMEKVNGVWQATVNLNPGVYHYKFVVDGNWLPDPNNPARVDDNFEGFNTVFTLTENGEVKLEGFMSEPATLSDDYPKRGGTLYLNIIWHQHQPSYLDPAKDQLRGPWVRTHATKDYYDMCAMLGEFPDVHCTINLTSSLLWQLQTYYVERLSPFLTTDAAGKAAIDAENYFKKWGGKTDPWIDIALTPAEELDDEMRAHLLTNNWNGFSISPVMIARFPEYETLSKKDKNVFTTDELRQVKGWFFLAYFDPDFLRGTGVSALAGVDLSDLLREEDGKFYLRRPLTEEDCNRLVAEAVKVCQAIVPIHCDLMFDIETCEGQIEIVTTPFYHPILPLIYNSDLARVAMPNSAMPSRFHFPRDANAQVVKATKFYRQMFGKDLRGMWPGEGSVAKEIIPILARNEIRWIATDMGVLAKSTPPGQPLYYPYLAEGGDETSVTVVFRETDLSDRIGFRYQQFHGEAAADDFIRGCLEYAPKEGEDDRLLTVILDGENAWEWYKQDIDGKEFLRALYRKLTKLYHTRQIVTVTPSEYFEGNVSRNVPSHPPESLPKLSHLWPGSWIHANFDTWIGEPEENRAWEMLKKVRTDLATHFPEAPHPWSERDAGDEKYQAIWDAYEAMYAAEGSDWFWWFGDDQETGSGDAPFDDGFRILLRTVYEKMRLAGAPVEVPDLPPILLPKK